MRSPIANIKNGLKAHIRLFSFVYLFIAAVLFGFIAAAIIFFPSTRKNGNDGLAQNLNIGEIDKIQKTLDIINKRDKEFFNSKNENLKNPF